MIFAHTKIYLNVWKQLANCAFSSYLSFRIDSFTFLLGKLIRFAMFLVLIYSIFNHAPDLVGYNKYEVVLFFLTFNLMDVIPQALFRGIYNFREDVNKGKFDFVLVKPINPLFYSIVRLTDILDMVFILPIIALIIYTISRLNLNLGFTNIAAYILFIIVGQVIILGIHIVSASVTMLTESENFIWLYRESMTIGRFPPELYSTAVQLVFTFVIPVILVVAIPAKALLFHLNWNWAIITILYAFVFFVLSLKLWNISLKKYSSASS